MSEHTAEKDAGLWMYGDGVAQVIGGRPCSGNRRPLDSHDRHLHASDADRARGIDDAFLQRTHLDHGGDAWCALCGCCWCCDDDCCAEYICPNEDCGCSEKPAPTYVTPPEVGAP